MKSRDMLKKIRLKRKLMKECGSFVEDLSDYTESANYCKVKNFTRFSRRTFMKDYRKAMKLIDIEFGVQNANNGVSRGTPLEQSGAKADDNKKEAKKETCLSSEGNLKQ